MRFLRLFVGLHFYGSIVKDVVLLLVPAKSDPASIIIETIEEGGDEADATKHSEGQGHGLELVLENSTKKSSYTLAKTKMSSSSHSIQCCKCPLRSINLDILCHGNSEKIHGEHFQSFKREGKPGTLYEGISNISDSVHEESQDEYIDNTNLSNNIIRVK